MAQADFTRISSNIAALNTLNSLRNINTRLGVAQLRLATGRRINQASDDPAGLTIALKMRARNQGLQAALGNIGDAKNMLAVGESGLQQMADILTEMKAKATQAATETLGTEERGAIKTQLESLVQQIDDIVSETTWNDEKLLGNWSGGALSMSRTLQTGAGATDITTWNVSTDHRATQADGLDLATTSITSNTAVTSGSTVDTSFYVNDSATGVTISSGGAWLSALTSGTYELEVLGKGTATTGAATKDGGDWGASAALGVVAPDSELASGRYRMHIDESSGPGEAKYTIYNAVTGAQVAQRTTEVDFTTGGAGGAVNVIDDSNNKLGITIDDNTDKAISVGDDIYFDYIAINRAKMKLSEIEGSTETALAVDADGSDGTGTDSTNSAFYVDVSGAEPNTYDTGKGITVNLKALASVTTGHKSRFDYTEAGVSIRLASAAAATTFMGKVDDAITTVTASLNGIGSLVARLDAKEMGVGVAQVNVEAAYNRIMNADMAYEQVEASKYMILQQTAIAMLAQANMAPQGILSLFR